MILLIAFLVFFFTVSTSALPNCPSGTSCPPGGLWSEWVLTGSKHCPTECGACGKLFYTRKCISSRVNCPCVGPSTTHFPCNIQTCKFPAQRTCCIPYTSMVINGSLQCGPAPREIKVGSGPCCPVGGMWTEWSKYELSNGTYTKTRECTSLDAKCPCTGSDKMTTKTAPCPRRLKNANVCASIDPSLMGNYIMDHSWGIIIDDSKGTAILELANHNDQPTVTGIHCGRYHEYPVVSAIFLLAREDDPDFPRCIFDRPTDCRARGDPDRIKYLPVSFTCDLETELWRYDYLGVLVEGYNQPRFINPLLPVN